MHQFPKFTPTWNSTCFGQFLCPSSRVYPLYSRHWYMSCRFVGSFQAGPSWSCLKAVFKPVLHIPVPSVQWINSWWWSEELPETSRVSCRSKFGKLMHLVGLIRKKSVMMHGHMNGKKTQYYTVQSEIWVTSLNIPQKRRGIHNYKFEVILTVHRL